MVSDSCKLPLTLKDLPFRTKGSPFQTFGTKNLQKVETIGCAVAFAQLFKHFIFWSDKSLKVA